MLLALWEYILPNTNGSNLFNILYFHTNPTVAMLIKQTRFSISTEYTVFNLNFNLNQNLNFTRFYGARGLIFRSVREMCVNDVPGVIT